MSRKVFVESERQGDAPILHESDAGPIGEAYAPLGSGKKSLHGPVQQALVYVQDVQ